jgi:tetratricopeptide (TPR) repeat protein
MLGFYSSSSDFPDDLKRANITAGDLVAGWVHANRTPLFIEKIETNDGRVSDLERNFTAIASAPISTRESWGVLYAFRLQPIGEDEDAITPLDKHIFSMLAGIAGEISYNEKLLVENARNAVRAISGGPVTPHSSYDLIDRLKTEFTWIQSKESKHYTEFNLSAIVISVNNLKKIAELCGASVSDWLEQQVLETSVELFGREIKDRHKGQQDIFRVHPGRFVLLILRTRASEDEIKNVVITLKKALSNITLSTPFGLERVEFLSWGIVYAYDRYLTRKLGRGESQLPGRSPQELAKWLYERFQSAALALSHNGLGHLALERRAYAAAVNHFTDAWDRDKESPYYPKHIAEALKGSGDLERALYYCDLALKVDDDYAGGYYMKAEILTALGKIDEASREYETAIEISPRAKFYWLFASSLVKYGRYDKAIEIFKEVQEIDPENEIVYQLLIARTETLQGKPVEARHKLEAIFAGASAFEIIVHFETKLLDSIREDVRVQTAAI